MPVQQDQRSIRNSIPVTLHQRFSGDGGLEAAITSDSDAVMNAVFNAYGVESVTELEAQELGNSSRPEEVRLGLFCKRDSGDDEFITERELLQRVEGISEELTAGLVDEFGDIPTLCERKRGAGDVFFGDLIHDLTVQRVAWVDELEAFVDELGEWDTIESRMKDAGIWVEPQNTIPT